MSNYDKMLDQFKTIDELKQFAEAQYQTILDLSKKNSRLEEEVNHLQVLLTQTVPLIKPESSVQQENDNIISISENNQEQICRLELKKLRDLSIERVLTLEEAKKVEIYTKLLLSLQEKSKKSSPAPETRDVSELLAIVEGKENGTK